MLLPQRPLRVWYINLEDPLEELKRRKAAFCLHHNIGPRDFGNDRYMMSGREMRADMLLVRMEKGQPVVVEANVQRLIQGIVENDIDLLQIDPGKGVHTVPENDNTAMDIVADVFRRVAEEGGCAVSVCLHARKANGTDDADVDTMRGAKAMSDASRTARVLTLHVP